MHTITDRQTPCLLSGTDNVQTHLARANGLSSCIGFALACALASGCLEVLDTTLLTTSRAIFGVAFGWSVRAFATATAGNPDRFSLRATPAPVAITNASADPASSTS